MPSGGMFSLHVLLPDYPAPPTPSSPPWPAAPASVLGTSNLGWLRLLGAKVHTGSIGRAPGWGGRVGVWADGGRGAALPLMGLFAHSSRWPWCQDQGLTLQQTSTVFLPSTHISQFILSLPWRAVTRVFLFPFSVTRPGQGPLSEHRAVRGSWKDRERMSE